MFGLLISTTMRAGSRTGIIGAPARAARSEGGNLTITGPSTTYREPSQIGASPTDFEAGRPLPPALLYRSCDPAELPFELVGELEDLLEPIGQDRAVEAVAFALAMQRKGYNVYALGASGTGR